MDQIEAMIDEENQEVEQKIHKLDPNIIVELDNVSKTFNRQTWAVRKVDLQIRKGECIALLGANGSGKSTLGRLIANVIKQTSGIIDYYFKEENIFNAIGYQAREQAWPNGFKVSDVTSLWINIYNVQDQEWVARLRNVFGIDDIWNKALSKLSIVNLQLFAIFLAMIHKPELLVIDDLSSALDYERKSKIIDLLKEYLKDDNTIVLIYPDEYIMSVIASRVIYLHKGTITDDLTVKQIKKEYGSIFEFNKMASNEEINKEKRKKTDPFFRPLLRRYKSLLDDLQNVYDSYFANNLSEIDAEFDLNVKNGIFYVNELGTQFNELASSDISKKAIDAMKEAINKVVKEIKRIIKLIKKEKKVVPPIKHLEQLQVAFERILNFLTTKLKDSLKNNKIIINGNEVEIELPKAEKKRLEELKERYIKEELKIIRLEKRKAEANNKWSFSLATNRLMRNLSPKERAELKKNVGAQIEDANNSKNLIAVLQKNNNLVLKDKNSVKESDFPLFNKKISTNFGWTSKATPETVLEDTMTTKSMKESK
ncbi:ATP-binding cassette domain-containing protein [Mesoplasma lactucae]|uniref:Uncharacterized protein n=1 Tax=Mesoplasma lactucae ATCC 49193 TaxID=81460 RepID=A0A291IRI9_9MOLU|nr:ATP-binding cassette domain-containing protein [Mesoplasma lactucae]ATG97482.1 hypothetical protein CP520_01790 [Mesoplasma lactucae ATCC 49193]ATZ20063.1 ABC transporter ATP-binding protein [Mesoplasma lactucae ATCC 49193]MCL8216811.1 hypothetical protein [Mesoplasma lactucae ATCC 49193]